MRSGKKIPCTLLSNREAVCKAASVEEMKTIVRGEISLLQLLRCPETTNFSGLLTRIPASKRQICMHSGQGHSTQQTNIETQEGLIGYQSQTHGLSETLSGINFLHVYSYGKESADSLWRVQGWIKEPQCSASATVFSVPLSQRANQVVSRVNRCDRCDRKVHRMEEPQRPVRGTGTLPACWLVKPTGPHARSFGLGFTWLLTPRWHSMRKWKTGGKLTSRGPTGTRSQALSGPTHCCCDTHACYVPVVNPLGLCFKQPKAYLCMCSSLNSAETPNMVSSNTGWDAGVKR